MIHGKFFTGLPPKMMDRHTGPNRQQSNLFWPDESDIESASESQSKRRNQKIIQQTSVDSNSPSSPDVQPRELFKKQLTSKIEFYDLMDEPSASNSGIPSSQMQTPKIDESYGKQKKIETFSSKIEFYDFANDPNTYLPKPDKNSKIDVERNSKNSPKNIDKRIKFVEKISPEDYIPRPKGILKNNETYVKNKPVQEQPRKKLIKKRNLSKSVENLSIRSREFSDDDDDNGDYIKIIENDVKNIAINDQQYEKEEATGRRGCEAINSRKSEMGDSSESQLLKLNKVRQTNTGSGRQNENGWNEGEQIDENLYRKSGNNETHIIYHKIHGTENDFLKTSKIESPKSDQHHQFFSTSCPPPQDNVILNNEISRRPNETVKSQDIFVQQQQQQQQQQQNKNQPPPSHYNFAENNRSRRHLVSSINFGNDIEATTDRPPKSVRSSAVMRVSVGLPD